GVSRDAHRFLHDALPISSRAAPRRPPRSTSADLRTQAQENVVVSRILRILHPLRSLALSLALLAPACAIEDPGEDDLSLAPDARSEEHTSELQSRENLVC